MSERKMFNPVVVFRSSKGSTHETRAEAAKASCLAMLNDFEFVQGFDCLQSAYRSIIENPDKWLLVIEHIRESMKEARERDTIANDHAKGGAHE